MGTLKKVIKSYNETSLIIRIVIGLAIGIVLALACPGVEWIGFLGDIFVGALKAIAPVLVFVLVTSSLCQGREKLGSKFRTVIILYVVSTFLAAVISVIASFMFPVSIKLTQSAGTC